MSQTEENQSLPMLRIAACSYEGSLFGWNVEQSQDQEGLLELSSALTFGFHATIGALKAVACSRSGKYLVAGGMDERIRIYDMKTNKSVGDLSQHTGAITALKFFNDAYLLSASEDCNLCIWRVYDWQCVHILGGHKDTILDFSIHPTGKMALSVSKDHTLKLWNLVQGRCAFTRRLKQPTDQVIWHSTGDYYLLVSTKDIQLFKAADNSCQATVPHGSRINRACFTTVAAPKGGAAQWRIATVCDNKSVNLFDFEGKQTASVDLTPLGSGRPRDVTSASPDTAAITDAAMNAVVATETECLVIGTSQGQVLVLSANRLEQLGVQEQGAAKGEDAAASALLSSHQLRAEPRLTAIVAWNPALAAAHAAAKGNKRAKPMMENEAALAGTKSTAAEDGEGSDEEDAEPVPVSKKATQAKGKGQEGTKEGTKEYVKKRKGEHSAAGKEAQAASESVTAKQPAATKSVSSDGAAGQSKKAKKQRSN